MRICLVLIVTTLLAACGPAMQWTRPNTSVAELDRDNAECASLARQQAVREDGYAFAGFGGYYGPGYWGPGYWGPRYGHPWHPYGYSAFPYGYNDPYMWRMRRESDLQDFCLRARGYSLTPVPKTTGG